jgi:pyruvate dehydrogenase E2 component (dihydrolipoamide acetyltransferase)
MSVIDVRVPDIGDFKDVPVIEVLVKPGDTIAKETPLVVLESEKASMEVPSSAAGTVSDVKVKPGDKVSEGSVLLTISSEPRGAEREQRVTPSLSRGDDNNQPADATQEQRVTPSVSRGDDNNQPADATQEQRVTPSLSRGDDNNQRRDATQQVAGALRQAQGDASGGNGALVHASPAIRRFARELGVDLQSIEGSGPHGRVTRDDVQSFVKSALKGGALPQARGDTGGTLAGLPAWPKVDFAQYGPIERKPLSRIKKLSGPNLHRNWLRIPHITNYDEADVTELEAFRNEINVEQSKRGEVKLTMLAFLVKAAVATLSRFPEFNASLDGDELIYKKYYNIGFAADTPNGLIVPLIKNADTKGLLAVASESADLARKAREGKLSLGDMQGGTFTISSIGGIGGTAFTQIVNAPEVAILGAVRTATKPIWNGSEFVPRLMLPISVSYDHRVIDGAGAARFLAYLASVLADFKRVSL